MRFAQNIVIYITARPRAETEIGLEDVFEFIIVIIFIYFCPFGIKSATRQNPIILSYI